jgi:hypothetical protein
MEKTLIKSMFGYDAMKQMQPGDVINVVCSSYLEKASVLSQASQFPKAYPQYNIKKMKCDPEIQGNCYIVKVTAIA